MGKLNERYLLEIIDGFSQSSIHPIPTETPNQVGASPIEVGNLDKIEVHRIFWVTRAKENMVYEVVPKMPASKDPKI
jgi:hypothetical protein